MERETRDARCAEARERERQDVVAARREERLREEALELRIGRERAEDRRVAAGHEALRVGEMPAVRDPLHVKGRLARRVRVAPQCGETPLGYPL
jgi:hypothetical protein